MLTLGQLSILSGVLKYNKESESDSTLGIVHIVVYFAILLIIEVIYRIYRARKPKQFTQPEKTMTVAEFERLIRE